MRLIRYSLSSTTNFFPQRSLYSFSSRFPIFEPSTNTLPSRKLKILSQQQAKLEIQPAKLSKFLKDKVLSVVKNNENAQEDQTTTFYTPESIKKVGEIKKNMSISFSKDTQNCSNFRGIASDLLSKSFKFSRKQKNQENVKIYLDDFNQKTQIIELAKANMRSAQWANMRGDESPPQYFQNQAQRILKLSPKIKLTTIKGDKLLDQGFRLMHAVGRASKNEPIMVCLQYKGNPQSSEYEGWVGKGVCFDTGGLHLKPTASINGMHIDKHGATSVLSAFESVVNLDIKTNVVAVIGLAENFVSQNSYRPLDILKSRKGLTVQIGNTDAQGRLILADCMHYIQTKYKLKNLLELSTLTGAIVIALGKNRAGVFTNSTSLSTQIQNNGSQVNELTWRMPIDEYHQDIIKSKYADISNAPGKPQGSSCQAGAFLKCFVQDGVQWAHIDIAGVANCSSPATGYGARLLVNFALNGCQK